MPRMHSTHELQLFLYFNWKPLPDFPLHIKRLSAGMLKIVIMINADETQILQEPVQAIWTGTLNPNKFLCKR